jgi:hypothetical protein
VPDKATDCGLVVALCVTVIVDVRLPSADGSKVTMMLQLFPAPSMLGLMGQFPPDVKSPGAVPPLIVMLVIVSGTVCVFLKVVVLAALATPTA